MSVRDTFVNPLRENPEGIFAFQWHITDHCDQRCRHCYIFAENRGKPLVSMSFGQMREVLARCDAFTAGMDMKPLFNVTGGDPILHPDFWRLAELMKAQGRPFAVMAIRSILMKRSAGGSETAVARRISSPSTARRKRTTGSASPAATGKRWRRSP